MAYHHLHRCAQLLKLPDAYLTKIKKIVENSLEPIGEVHVGEKSYILFVKLDGFWHLGVDDLDSFFEFFEQLLVTEHLLQWREMLSQVVGSESSEVTDHQVIQFLTHFFLGGVNGLLSLFLCHCLLHELDVLLEVHHQCFDVDLVEPVVEPKIQELFSIWIISFEF